MPVAVQFRPTKFKPASRTPGVWSPAVTPEAKRKVYTEPREGLGKTEKDERRDSGEPIPPVWTPRNAGQNSSSDPITFRPIHFQSPTLPRKISKQNKEVGETKSKLPVPVNETANKAIILPGPPSKVIEKEEADKNLRTNRSSKVQPGVPIQSDQSPLPKSQNPTITLLQKAREGQLSKGAQYLDDKNMYSKDSPGKKKLGQFESYQEVRSETNKGVNGKLEQAEKTKSSNNDGISLDNISELKNENQQKWYKRMYESLHHANQDKSNVTVRYWPNPKVDRAKSPKEHHVNSGYSSEPEIATVKPSNKLVGKYSSLDRRRSQSKENDASYSSVPRSKPSSEALKHAVEVYNNQPGRIENYEPGCSSIADKETKEWWDEMMEIFDKQYGETGQRNHTPTSNTPTSQKKHFMTYTLKDGGYESDSSLIFKRRDENSDMSPKEKKIAYKEIQKGGEVPLHGLRKPAPERPKDDSVIEYFPISAHLTKIRVHKSRCRQPVEPLKEIICYPVTSIEHSNILPVFSQFKRSVPPASSVAKKSPEPPSPPKRHSSRKNSTLQLVSKISISPQKPRTKVMRSASGVEVDSNVEYLKERLKHKLGVSDNDTKKSQSFSGFGLQKSVITCCPSFSKSASSSQKSSTSGSKRTVLKPVSKIPSPSESSVNLNKQVLSSIKSRKEKQETNSKKLSAPSDLKSPAEVSKVLSRSYISDQKERPARNPSKLPPGTVIRSSTTYYNSNNPRKLNQDKAFKVTVAISAKGRELLRPTAISCLRSSSEPKSSSPKKILSNFGLRNSKGIACVKNGTDKGKITLKNDAKKSVSDSDTQQNSLTENRLTSPSPDRAWCIPSAEPKVGEKLAPTVSPAKKRFKAKEVWKQRTVAKTSMDKKSDSEAIKDESSSCKSLKLGKKKAKKQKSSDSETQGEETKKKKSNFTDIQVDTIPTSRLSPTSVASNELISLTDLTHELKSSHSQSDNFYQNLLLHSAPSSTPSIAGSIHRSPSVQERTKNLFKQDSKSNFKSEPSLKLLNVYLTHKKPVSESKFKSLDHESRLKVKSRSLSPSCSLRRAEFFDKIEKFDVDNVWTRAASRTHSRHESPAVLKGRSSSEPPPSSPSDDNDSNAPSPFCCGLKSALLSSERSIFPQSRSPSCRRIQSAKSSVKCVDPESDPQMGEASLKGASKSSLLEKNFKGIKSASSLNLSQFSDFNDYQAYILELMHSAKKCERFKELHKFYKNLERLGQLERTTSTNDLKPRLKNEEIIDFDRWKNLRKKEKAEEELEDLYKKLREDQKEKDLVFLPKDVDSFRWKLDKDRGLKNREKSVEDIKQQFYKMSRDVNISKSRSFSAERDTYKPLWRGSSVVDLASSLASVTSSHHGKPVFQDEKLVSTMPRPSSSKYGKYIGTRLWSSLSMDQVNALKSQLNEIYSTVSSLKRERLNKMFMKRSNNAKGKENYEIEIPAANETKQSSKLENNSLHVRCNSLLSYDQTYSPAVRKRETKRSECTKANSIGSIPDWKSSFEKSFLSETEKKKLSMKLSREVLDCVTKKNSFKSKRSSGSLVIPRETLGAIASIEGAKKVSSTACSVSSISSPRTCYSIDLSDSENHHNSTADEHQSSYMLVLKPSSEEANNRESKTFQESPTAAHPVLTTSNSETESGSSEASTVIHLGFQGNSEKSKANAQSSYNSLKLLDGKNNFNNYSKLESNDVHASENDQRRGLKSQCSSQSFADFKEIFGERQLYHNSLFKSSSQCNSSFSDTLPKSFASARSEEMMFRSRSTTPDPMKYYRAYLNMVKTGDVRRLREKFESVDDLQSLCSCSAASVSELPLKKYQSDPELTRIFLSQNDKKSRSTRSGRKFDSGDVKYLTNKYECKRIANSKEPRLKCRPISPKVLSRNRYMPHINVISKSASLQSQTRPSSTPKAYKVSEVKLPAGAVERIRHLFELKQSLSELSLMGHMYTSTPNIRELNEIAPYLECQWIAHQHPDPASRSWSRSLSSPVGTSSRQSPVYLLKPRPQSTSPSRKRQPSILKAPKDVFAHQKFDPTIHQPTFRYQPPPTPEYAPHSYDRYHFWRSDPLFWCKYLSSKPTVTFKESIMREVPASPSSPNQLYSPNRFSESPAGRYAESAVTLQYRRPVLAEVKDALSEDELVRRQAEAMRRLYQEERRRKYLQELHDISSRRHTDHFIPSQKSPIPLNRYDDFCADEFSIISQTPEPKLVARALYNFVGQSSRELSFRRGDIIYVRRQIDKNWYEGEHNAMIGLFPLNYVEIIPYDNIRTNPKKPAEGQARAKFNFVAQTHLELSLVKGELVALTRRVDNNWFEGRIGNRHGIFPVSYVDVLVEPGERALSPTRPITPASPSMHSILSNGSSQTHQFQPMSDGSSDRFDGKPLVSQTLHVDTQSDPIPYKALYSYRPQNEDELELREGDTVFVIEKCDDGWYVGSSQRTGAFGTFPGNYVQRVT